MRYSRQNISCLSVSAIDIPEEIMKLEDFAAYNHPQSKVSDEKKFLDDIHSQNRWVEFIKSIDNANPISIAMKNSFHSQWVESGAFIREKINDDSILLKLLTLLLPTYDGDSLVLYRGENKDRFDKGLIGFCWTTDISVAEKFGRGLNAYKSPGLLLRAEAPACSILAGPNAHSRYLGENEFTVNPSRLSNITVIETYPDNSFFR
ncbi:hypothetical protein ABGD77_004372 [Escherichia coli]|nr:hypothetical protein [Escherichia coli]EFP0830371.1 hypothetical protein [Escherichia coli]EHQ9011474.1 hypothetical protein [Escherichia coli]EHW7735819.1 hypothetical protein [Escherichia coli]HAG5975515.1 hypothetical protein [Escherichia coli]